MGDWRSSLFTIFVGNLSYRVPRRALWEAFLSYGRVMDVYIPRDRKHPSNASTFAFVRYKRESEMIKAIEYGNGRLVDGWSIKVKKATYGWGDRAKPVSKQQTNTSKSNQVHGAPAALRDDRTYRDVLNGGGTGPRLKLVV